jgi:hypothetical protein
MAPSMPSGQISDDWSGPLAALPLRLQDVYFTPAYHALHGHEGVPWGFSFTRDGHSLIVPGLRIGIDASPASDLQTPNGYGGPLASEGAPSEFLEDAWREWREAVAAEGIVAGFFRLHPLLANRRWLPSGARIELDRKTVYVSLSEGLEPVWSAADSRHRNMVNRGRKEGTVIRWNDPEDWHDFEALYAGAMGRLNAPTRLRFDAAYFAGLRAIEGTELACSRDARGLVAGNVFLWGPLWGHYHLAARRDDAPNFIMNLLMQAGFERAFARGLEGVHLGGGASTATDDGVLKFKRSFGGTLRDFEVGLVISDVGGYQALVEEWANREGRRPSWLLGYRQPRSARES